jgi:hypothetical protein
MRHHLDLVHTLYETIDPQEGEGRYWFVLSKDGYVRTVNENDDDLYKLWNEGWDTIWDSAKSDADGLKFGEARGLKPFGASTTGAAEEPAIAPERRAPAFVPDGRERYRGALAQGSRGQTIEITKPLRAYHATHKGVDLVLSDRVAETYDSIGTWLSSNKAIAQKTYGPHVAAYEVPPGTYMLARHNQDLRELILSCLPMIKRHVGNEVYKYIRDYPDDAENRKFLTDVRARAKELAKQYGDDQPGAHNNYVHDALQRMPQGSVKRYRELQRQHNMYREVAINPDYSKAYKAWLIQCGYTGIIWNNRHWDTTEGRQTIFLILKHEDLHPLAEGWDEPGRLLTEGAFSDAVAAAVKKLRGSPVDAQDVENAAATAENSGNSAVAQLAGRIIALAKAAPRNIALLTVLAALATTFGAAAANPAATTAAAKVEQILAGQDVDAILSRLKAAGIDATTAAPGLPPEMTPRLNKAVSALRAIANYEFQEGTTIASSRELATSTQIIADVVKASSILRERILVTTADRSLVLADLTTEATTDDTGSHFETHTDGVKMRLLDYLQGADDATMAAVDRYLSQGAQLHEGDDAALPTVQAVFEAKADALTRLVASAVASKADGSYRVIIAAGKVSVAPHG